MGFENFKKILGITAVGIGTAGAVEAQGPSSINDGNELAKIDSKKNEYKITSNEIKPDLNKATKVNKQPEGTKPYGKIGDREYFIRTIDGGNTIKVEIGKNTNKPHKNVHRSGSIKKVFSKNIAPKVIKKDVPPNVEIFYIEPEKNVVEKEVDPYAAYAVVGNAVYHNGVSGHNTGQMYYLSMHSKNIQEGGMTDTGNEDFVIRLQDGNGKPILKDSKGNPVPEGLSVRIKAGDKNSIMNGAGRLLPGAYEKLIKLAEEQRELNKNKQEIQQIGPDFSTRADTVKL